MGCYHTLSVTYNGSNSSKSTTFTVNGSSGSVTVASVWTADGSGNNKTTFNPGDAIRMYGNVSNTTGSSRTAAFVWSVSGPCWSGTLYSGNLTTGTGTWTWNLQPNVPSSACAGTYTYTLSVTYNGSKSSKSTTFTVNPSNSGSVTVASVWTADGSGNGKTTFNPGDAIRMYGNVSNTTGSSRTAAFVWSVSGPCWSGTLYSGNLTTGTGTWTWYLQPNVPSGACAGTYTYTLSVTYNGSKSSKSTTFTVNLSNNGKKVMLDPGHGWCPDGVTPGPNCVVDVGNTWNGMKEKDVTLDIALRTKTILQGRGINVGMTRTGDVPTCGLSCTTSIVNQFAPDVAVSIHTNASNDTTAHGTEAWYTKGKSTDTQSYNLAVRLSSSVASRLSITNRGAKSEANNNRIWCPSINQYCFFIHWWNPPSSIIETAFQSNPTEANMLLNRRQDFAQAIADAIAAYLGIP